MGGGGGEGKAKRENMAMILGSKLGWGLGAQMALDSQPRATVIGVWDELQDQKNVHR